MRLVWLTFLNLSAENLWDGFVIFQNTKYENVEDLNIINQDIYSHYYVLYNKIDSIKYKDIINDYKNEMESSIYLKNNINICKLKDKDMKKFEKYVRLLEIN